jgi:hypothetical protein
MTPRESGRRFNGFRLLCLPVCTALFIFLGSALPVSAQERCPWLNAATAAGALDSAVTMTVSHPAGKPGESVCDFSHKPGPAVRQIRITVEVMADPAVSFASYLARCGAGATPLKAVGNEAITCPVAEKNVLAEQVIGRVRDQAFVILIRSNDKDLADTTLHDRARRIAEQVAGNLF